jgi:hypothetical protein
MIIVLPCEEEFSATCKTFSAEMNVMCVESRDIYCEFYVGCSGLYIQFLAKDL